jgi:hypothetical protein
VRFEVLHTGRDLVACMSLAAGLEPKLKHKGGKLRKSEIRDLYQHGEMTTEQRRMILSDGDHVGQPASVCIMYDT